MFCANYTDECCPINCLPTLEGYEIWPSRSFTNASTKFKTIRNPMRVKLTINNLSFNHNSWLLMSVIIYKIVSCPIHKKLHMENLIKIIVHRQKRVKTGGMRQQPKV